MTSGKRTLVSGYLVGWEASAAFPLARIRASLGQAGELATETQVHHSYANLVSWNFCDFSTTWDMIIICAYARQVLGNMAPAVCQNSLSVPHTSESVFYL